MRDLLVASLDLTSSTTMADGRTAAQSDTQGHPRSRSESLSPAPEYIPQPDHFYLTTGPSTSLNADPTTSSKGGINTGSRYQLKMNVSRDLRPEDDPLAARGIPVFKPTWWEFQDFEKYMNSIEPWGTRSGIVKVIPPKQWSVLFVLHTWVPFANGLAINIFCF
jgi:hypothetical protein